jgi:hypothetical protein
MEENQIDDDRPIVRRFRGDESLTREQRFKKLMGKIKHGKITPYIYNDAEIIHDQNIQDAYDQNGLIERLQGEIRERQRIYDERVRQFQAENQLRENDRRQEREELARLEQERLEQERLERQDRERREDIERYSMMSPKPVKYLYINGELVENPDMEGLSKRASKKSKRKSKKNSKRKSKKSKKSR